VCSYHTVSPLPTEQVGSRRYAVGGNFSAAYCLPPTAYRLPGGLLSVALSLVFRPVGVTHHHVLWSPDFPPAEDLCGLTAVLNQRHSSRRATDSHAAVPSSAGDHPVRYRTVQLYDTEARRARQVRGTSFTVTLIDNSNKNPRASTSSAVIVKGTWVGLNLRQPNRRRGSIPWTGCWPI
jgi:hypothetical protein